MKEVESRHIEKNYSWKYNIVFFIIIFISDDTYNFGSNENFVYIFAKYIIYFILTIYLLSKIGLKSITFFTRGILVFFLIMISILITSFFNFDISGGYIYQIWLFLLGFLLVNFYSYKQFIYLYSKFIYVLAVISLIAFVISSIIPSVIGIFPKQINSAGASVHNLWLCVVSLEYTYLRNMSIFREPGVYMIYLNFAIIFELFFKEEINKRNLLVFVLAIVSTLSTAAFIALGTIFIAYLFTKSKTKASQKTKAFIIAMILISIMAIAISGELYSMVFGKVSKDNVGDGSSLARGVSVVANFNIFLDNFLFGVGIRDYPLLFEKYTLDLVGIALETGNNTNTITTILAVYGLLFGSLFVYMLICFAKKTSKSIIVRVFIFLVLIMFYSNEDLRYSIMSATMLMFGLTSRKEANFKNKNN
ncbi:hypothetical protein [Flavobacterium sp.]|uniref:hypothetical protein n=1 Tax=Flavobacterium sp. TaxID=239 RepID=UPI0032669BB6